MFKSLLDQFIDNMGDIDKLAEIYPVRVPEVVKSKLDKLSPSRKKRVNMIVLIAIAWGLYEAEFDPRIYLKSQD